MKHRHYGVVVVATLLAVAVLWQVSREVVPSTTAPLASSVSVPAMGGAPVVAPSIAAKALPPAASSPSFAMPPELGAARKAEQARMEEQRKAHRDADNSKQVEQDARRKADDEVRHSLEQARNAEAEVRQRQDELSRQQKPVIPEQKTPQQVCADRPNFISRGICEARECEKPEREGLPFCIDMNERRAPRDFVN